MSQMHDELIHHNHAYNDTRYCTSCTEKVRKNLNKLSCKTGRHCDSLTCPNSCLRYEPWNYGWLRQSGGILAKTTGLLDIYAIFIFMLLCCLDKKSTTCHMWISSCCSFGKKWAHSKHHWCSTPMCCCLALSLQGSLQVQKLRQERTSFVQGCRLSQRFNKPTNRVNPHRLHDAFNAFIFPPSISCYHRNPLPKDGPRPCFCWFHGRGSSQVEWPFGFDTHPWSRQIDHSGTALQKGEAMVTIWSFPAVSSQISKNTEKHFVQTLNSNDVSSI